MNRSYFKFNLLSLMAIAGLLFGVPSHGIAQAVTSTLSGRVVDIERNPVSGFVLAIEPFEGINGTEQRGHIPAVESQTDAAGRFSISNIVPTSVQLVTQTSGYVIQFIKIGTVAVYQHEPSPFGGIAFTIKPGAHIENVEVVVRSRMRIRVQVVFADGTPLADAQVGLKTRYRYLNGQGQGGTSCATRTDDGGYLVQHVDAPALYTITVNYQGFSVTVEPFMLQDGERKDDIVVMFDGNKLISIDSPTDRVEASAGASTSPSAGAGVWVVNPTNGHAYKSIHCKSWDDANSQAVAEDAHLVAINDEAEQKWLSKIFGWQPYWIGLTDFAEEGEWTWTNGEPVTYTNWAPHEPMDDDRGEEDYVVMFGEWSDIGTENVEWQMIRMAIIEKNNPSSKTLTKEK